MLSSLPLLLLGLFTFGAVDRLRAAGPLRRGGPGRAGPPRPLPEPGRLGHHHRLGPRTQPRRAGGRPRPVARTSRRSAAASWCRRSPSLSWRSASWLLLRPDPLLLSRRLGGRLGRTGGAAAAGHRCRRCGAVWGTPDGAAGAHVGRRLPLGDGRGHGHDAGAHGPRRRRRGDDAAGHRPGHQRARRRHVPLLPARRAAGRPRGPVGDRRAGRGAAAGRGGAGRHGRAGGRPGSWAPGCCCSAWAGRAASSPARRWSRSRSVRTCGRRRRAGPTC